MIFKASCLWPRRAERSGGEARVVLSGPATPLPSSALHPRHPGWALEAAADAQGSMEPALSHLFLTSIPLVPRA